MRCEDGGGLTSNAGKINSGNGQLVAVSWIEDSKVIVSLGTRGLGTRLCNLRSTWCGKKGFVVYLLSLGEERGGVDAGGAEARRGA
jgi:hypothetical protein